MPFAENLGTGGGSLDAQYGSSPTANTNAPLLLDPRTSGNFVYTPGTAGNYVAVPHSPSLNILGTEGTPFLSLPGFAISSQYASSPDTGALDITGDIDLRCRAQLTPVVPLSGNANLITKGGLGGNYAFFFGVDTAGRLFFEWSNNGVTTTFKTSTVAATVPAGVPYWYRTTMDADNGAGGNDIAFYVSPDGITWTQVGTTVTTAGVAVINNSASALQLGGYGGSSFTDGRIYRAQVLNGINGTVVFDADFTQQALGSRGFIESTGKLVSLVGDAAQIVDGTTYGTMPSTTVAAGWTVPDSAALDVSDLEITARLSLNDWTAATNQAIVAKWDNTGPQRSYIWFIATNGRPTINYDIGGVTQPALDAGAAYPFADGQTYWVRVRRIAATGVWRFYWAADSETEPTVWTNVGGDRAGTAGVLNNSTALTTIGAFNNAAGGYMAQGRMYRAIIRNANTGGTKVLDADFTRQLQFASTFTEGSSQLATVTTQGAARIERDRDLDLRVKVALDDWTPAGQQVLAAKWHPGRYSYLFMVIPTGPSYRLFLIVDSLGTGSAGLLSWTASADLTIADGEARWVRVALDVNNGANGNTATFYESSDGVTWTTVGVPQVRTGAISMFPGTQLVELGSVDTGTAYPSTGKFFNAEIRNGIDGPAVLDIDFTDAITTGAETYLPDTPSEVIPEALQFLPNLGWGGTALNARFGSAVGADTNDPLLLTHTGTNYLYLPGSSPNFATVPSAIGSQTDITGDIAIAINITNRTTADATFVLKREFGVDSSLTSYNFGQINVSGVLVYRFIWVQSDGTARDVITTIPFRTEFAHHAVTHVVNDGTGGNVVTFYASNDGVNWSLAGSVRNAYLTDHRSNAAQVGIGGTNVGAVAGSGEYRRVRIWNAASLSGTPVLDANFTTGITSGAQTTFTESSPNAATVTINRSTSGRKSVAVVQDVLLFGTDDYLEVPDSDLLDFGATDSFTVMSVMRQWNTPPGSGRFLGKGNFSVAPASWWLYSGANFITLFAVQSTFFAQALSPDVANGTNRVAIGVRDVATDQLFSYQNGIVGTPVTDTTTGAISNTLSMFVGRDAAGSYTDMEWRGSAVWRRALSAAEVALVNTHYTTGPTTASTALMQQAVWWVDAGTRSVAQINRSTSGRKSVACARCTWLLGTDDFFEVPASNLFDFAQGQDYTLLVLHRGWWAQGTNDTLLATTSSTTASAAGWAMSNSSGDPWQAGGRHGDGSNGVTAVAPRRDIGALSATWLVRDCDNDTLTAFTGSTSGTPVTDTTTGTIGNTNVMRLGRLSTTGAEYLDAEVVAAVVWRRRLTAAERNAVLAYYGV